MTWLPNEVVRRLHREALFPDLTGTRYRIVRFVAAGGMGEVYLACDDTLQRNVALKVLAAAGDSEELAARMLSEARIVAGLEHPGIVPVHDVGRLSDGRVFFTMKFVEGDRLDRHIRSVQGVPDRLRLFHKICEAVAFAHARGVVHRDLKPENMMVGRFGEVLVMDWGIAHVLADARIRASHPTAGRASGETSSGTLHSDAATTAAGAALGTPGYMAPEQISGGDATDERSDIYALGGILFALLTNQPPTSDPAQEASALRVSLARPATTSPRALAAVCMHARAASSADRYQTVAALAEDIIRYLDGNAVSVYRESLVERGIRWSRRYAFVLVLILAYLVMRALVFFFVER